MGILIVPAILAPIWYLFHSQRPETKPLGRPPAPGHVEVFIHEGEHGAVIRVKDSGPGIPKGDFANVLRRFYRGDRSRQTPGTGLGLSLVASIARLHGFGLALDDREAGCCIEIECWQH